MSVVVEVIALFTGSARSAVLKCSCGNMLVFFVGILGAIPIQVSLQVPHGSARNLGAIFKDN
jgi:hypothetical protein